MFGSAKARVAIFQAAGSKRGSEQVHRLLLRIKSRVQPGAWTVADKNNPLTDSRERTMIVNTPRIVPKGMKRHSMQAITTANEKCLKSASDRRVIKKKMPTA